MGKDLSPDEIQEIIDLILEQIIQQQQWLDANPNASSADSVRKNIARMQDARRRLMHFFELEDSE